MSWPNSGGAPVMVFSGDFWRGASGLGLAQGFRRQGWAVQEIDFSRVTQGFGRSLAGRILRRALAQRIMSDHAHAIRDAVAALNADVFFTIKGVGLSSQLLDWLKCRNVFTVVYYPDYHFDHGGVSLDVLKDCDLFVTSKSFQVDFLEAIMGKDRVAYVPHGYSDDVHWPLRAIVGDDDYAFDLQHIGAHSRYKQEWLKPLTSLVPPGRLRLVGARWTGLRAELPGAVVDDSFYDCAYSLALQSARINVAVPMGMHHNGWEDKVSTRTFEIPACRGFMLHIDNEEVREFFTPGEEIDVFSSSEELTDKVQFYLSRPALRSRMIHRAHQRCVPAYGYAARAAEIASLLTRIRFL